MLYLSGSLPSKPEVVALLRSVNVGLMMQPAVRYDLANVGTWEWAADNGCFAKTWREDVWVAWLERVADVPGCLFATVPDVVGDHDATVERWHRYWPVVAELGYRPAFVAQDGCSIDAVPWDQCGAVFLGGAADDVFKLGPTAHAIVDEANRRGCWTHMGRVNSLRRLRIAIDFGCDSADGTCIAFGPDVNTRRVLNWMSMAWSNPSLFATDKVRAPRPQGGGACAIDA